MQALRVLGMVTAAESAFGWLLTREGFDVRIEQEADEGLSLLPRWEPHAVILDWDMLGTRAPEVCKRAVSAVEPREGAVIAFSADGAGRAPREALAAGALDFLRKPLDALELYCRLKSHLSRLCADDAETVEVGGVALDARNHVARQGERSIPLTPSECAILRFLLTHTGRAVDVETLLVQALGYPARLGNPEIVRTHVRNLRQKLEPDPASPRLIVNIPRVGYLVRA